MADFYCITNASTTIIGICTVTTHFTGIDLQPGEKVYIRQALVENNLPALQAFGATITPISMDIDEAAFGPAYDRILNSIRTDEPNHFSWNPVVGFPTYDQLNYVFEPGTSFQAATAGVVPALPTPIQIERDQKIILEEWNPDGVQASQWTICPPSLNRLATVGDLQGLASDGGAYHGEYDPSLLPVLPMHSSGGVIKPGDEWTFSADGTFGGVMVSDGDTLTASVTNPTNESGFHISTNGGSGSNTAAPFSTDFVAVDFIGGVYSVPQTTHGLTHLPGQPFEVTVTDSAGGELIVCTATNPVTGEVTITTDGVPFAGTILITEN